MVDAALTDNWAGMKSLYARAAGVTTPNRKLWMFDVDETTSSTEVLKLDMERDGLLEAVIPSRRGEHLIVKPFDGRKYWGNHGAGSFGQVELKKDCNTNLYIPDEAA